MAFAIAIGPRLVVEHLVVEHLVVEHLVVEHSVLRGRITSV